MGNTIIGYDFVDYAPTASTEASGYADTNLYDYEHPKRPWRSTVATNTTIVFDLSSAINIIGVVLVDVNFAECYVQAHTADSWGAPDYRYPGAGNLTISQDANTERYSVFIPVDFTKQFMRLYIPTQTPIDSAAYFSIGTAVLLDTTITLSQNIFWPVEINAYEEIAENKFESGGKEKINLGDIIWRQTFGIDYMTATTTGQIKTINNLKKDALLVYYENFTDTSQTYVCMRDSDIEITEISANVAQLGRITLEEVR